jgi:hypothetical protein
LAIIGVFSLRFSRKFGLWASGGLVLAPVEVRSLNVGPPEAPKLVVALHPALDCVLGGAGIFPVDLTLLGEDDGADQRIGPIGTFNAAGSEVGLAFELLAAFAIVLFSAAGELSDELLIVGNRRSMSWPTLLHHSALRLA